MPSLPTAFSFYLSYMNQEIQSIIRRIESVNNGEPWFGRAAYSIMEEVNAKKAYIKPNNTEHSLIELLYHMITWADFTLKRIEKNKKNDLTTSEKLGGPLIQKYIPGKKAWPSLKLSIKK